MVSKTVLWWSKTDKYERERGREGERERETRTHANTLKGYEV